MFKPRLSLIGCFVAALASGPFAWAQDEHRSLELIRLINDYRETSGLPRIPVSRSMNTVASTHVADLQTLQPSNLHSWSISPRWTGGTFDLNNSATWPIMWKKPSELTSYRGNGYEIAYRHSHAATPAAALASWQGSPAHNSVILNTGMWASYRWNAIGAAVFGKYAVAWFGVEADEGFTIPRAVITPDLGAIGRRTTIVNQTGQRMRFSISGGPAVVSFELDNNASKSLVVAARGERYITGHPASPGLSVRRQRVQPGKTHIASVMSAGAYRDASGRTVEFSQVEWILRD
jgi:hypothetical protein